MTDSPAAAPDDRKRPDAAPPPGACGTADNELRKRAHEYTESIVATLREPLLVLDAELRVVTASAAFCRDFTVSREATEGRLVFDLGNRQWDIAELRHLLEQVLARGEPFNDYEVQHDFEHIGRCTMLLNARRLQQPGERRPAILLAIEDVTRRGQAQAASARLAAIVTSSRRRDHRQGPRRHHHELEPRCRAAVRLHRRGGDRPAGHHAHPARSPAGRGGGDSRAHPARRGDRALETVRRRKDGVEIDVSLTVSPIRDAGGVVVGASKIARDIGERRRAEAALHESRVRLERQVDELTRFNRVAVGRELRMIELKQEINELRRRLGEPARYLIDSDARAVKGDVDGRTR